MMIVGETAKILGHNIDSLSLNRSSIRRQREECRKKSAADLRLQFNPDDALIVHWDGKLLPELRVKEKVDRLPILVSSLDGGSQLLAVPKIASGTGKAQAQAVFDVLNEWKIQDKVQGMCFDTTSSNTGRKAGACIILEQLLGRDLIHLACRHHILELIAAAAFSEIMDSSSSPDILLFKRFQVQWKLIDNALFEDASTDQVTSAAIADIKEGMVMFLSNVLMEAQPRDDYRELIELTLIFLGTAPIRGVHFATPGPMHQARWMSKVIYTLKVWLFRSQFRLTTREETGLRNLCIFFTRLYVKAWISSPFAARAPNDDLQLIQSLVEYKKFNEGISKVTSEKLSKHLWYLSEELVGLAIFDENVSSEVKNHMVEAMFNIEGDDEVLKRPTVSLESIKNKSLVDFTTKNSRSLLMKLDLPQGFLTIPASQWKGNPDFNTARERVKALSVVNDHAERGVALIQEYSGRLTKNEDQLQFILQVVAEHRKKFPQALKKTLREDKECRNE